MAQWEKGCFRLPRYASLEHTGPHPGLPAQSAPPAPPPRPREPAEYGSDAARLMGAGVTPSNARNADNAWKLAKRLHHDA